MERLYQRLKDRGFVLLAVSQDEAGKPAVEAFVRDLGLTFPVLVDPEHQVGDRYQVWGYPESCLIDREGRIAQRIIGPRDWAAADQLEVVERHAFRKLDLVEQHRRCVHELHELGAE